jgi:hypothetical protein
MTKIKYTKELLEPIVKLSISVAEVIRRLGKRPSGSTQAHISKKIKNFGIDTSHFLGRAANSGKRHVGGPTKKTPSEILILRKYEQGRAKPNKLRRALIESGIAYKCSNPFCDIHGHWRGKQLTLQIDHVNGNFLDCRKNNVRFLCPNCHSQTENFGRVAQRQEAHV